MAPVPPGLLSLYRVSTRARQGPLRPAPKRKERSKIMRKRTVGIGISLAAAAAFGATSLPSTAQTTPIASEPLSLRAEFPDDVSMKIKLKDHHGETSVVQVGDPSRTLVVKYTVQPGAKFPWHSHTGPVVVNVQQGSLVYVASEGCEERTYGPGKAFVDAGHGHVHSAYNPGPDVTTFY